jgi:RNA polymerase sigma factor (sigma-70 family)
MSGTEEDDAAVIETSTREPARFGTIFDRHGPHIYRYLERRLGREFADDLTAETFLIAFRQRHRYHRDTPDARPWLYGIASNLVGQHRRHELRDYRLRQAVAPELPEYCHADQVATSVTAQSVRGLLVAALRRLAPRDRDVLLLIAWEAFSYEEVAAALQIPVGTVRSRLNRARTQIRAALGGADPTATHQPHEETIHNG